MARLRLERNLGPFFFERRWNSADCFQFAASDGFRVHGRMGDFESNGLCADGEAVLSARKNAGGGRGVKWVAAV